MVSHTVQMATAAEQRFKERTSVWSMGGSGMMIFLVVETIGFPSLS